MSYDTAEAARLISWSNDQARIGPLSESELVQWIDDGVGMLDWADVWEEDGEVQRYIDFSTLISLRLICLLRSHKVSFKDIDEAAALSKQKLDLDWPFASRSLWNLFSEDEKNATLIDSEAMTRIVAAMLVHLTGNTPPWGSLEFDQDGIACAWLPMNDVVMDPRVVSGSLCLAGTRIPTWVFPGMHAGGDSIAGLADDYGVTIERVELALEWERQLGDFGI